MLNKEELQLISDGDFLLRKREVSKKINKLLSECEAQLQPVVHQHLSFYPNEVLAKSGKISRGENYKGLPYLVLDFPRYSNDKKIFIYRTMFWWGHYFLCLLVTQNCGYNLNLSKHAGKEFHINHGETPWNYDVSDPCWKAFEETGGAQLPFISIGKKVDFNQIDELPELTTTTFKTIMSFLVK